MLVSGLKKKSSSPSLRRKKFGRWNFRFTSEHSQSRTSVSQTALWQKGSFDKK